jgi:hypothetical protein
MNIQSIATGGFVADWRGESGTAYQIITLGNSGVLFGAQASDGKWVTTPVSDPSRFGRFDTLKGFKAWVNDFVTDGEA